MNNFYLARCPKCGNDTFRKVYDVKDPSNLDTTDICGYWIYCSKCGEEIKDHLKGTPQKLTQEQFDGLQDGERPPRPKKEPKWMYWYLVTAVNPDSLFPLDALGKVHGYDERVQKEWPTHTKDGKDFCIGARLQYLCKLPHSYHKEHPETLHEILTRKVSRYTVQEEWK